MNPWVNDQTLLTKNLSPRDQFSTVHTLSRLAAWSAEILLGIALHNNNNNNKNNNKTPDNNNSKNNK